MIDARAMFIRLESEKRKAEERNMTKPKSPLALTILKKVEAVDVAYKRYAMSNERRMLLAVGAALVFMSLASVFTAEASDVHFNSQFNRGLCGHMGLAN